MSAAVYRDETELAYAPKVLHMRVGSATNVRTAIACFARGVPSGDTAASFYAPGLEDNLVLAAVLNSLAFDFVMRTRLTGLHLDYHVWEQSPLPVIPSRLRTALATAAFRLIADRRTAASDGLRLDAIHSAGVTGAERLRLVAALNAVVATLFGLTASDFSRIIEGCDVPTASTSGADSKGFWRIDGSRRPELRLPVLVQSALADLTKESKDGDAPDMAMPRLLAAGDDGWLLPETLRLTDYGLGHDDRASRHKPVATALGPRFCDWQLAQPTEEANRERHLHARNLLRDLNYARLIRQLERRKHPRDKETLPQVAEGRAQYDGAKRKDDPTDLFD